MTNAYVLLTAAYNEEKYITKTIESVIHQTVLPKCWVIVSDGSTDRTDDIVKEYAARHDFIQFARRDKKDGRDFSAKVSTLLEGMRLLADVDYSFYCTLDADVSFDKTYFQTVLDKFHENPRLGIAGGIIIEMRNNKSCKLIASSSTVTGAVQFFRRECFESTGGYVLASNRIRIGGEDTILEIKAKMNGWVVQAFPELHVCHYGAVGIGNRSPLKSRFKNGIRDYCIGKMFFFELIKCLYRFKESPFIIGSLTWFSGYLYSCLKRPEKVLSEEEIVFVRNEQKSKLKNIFSLNRIFVIS